MKIIVDAFGGDNAPLEILKGAADAHKEFGYDILITGDEGKIKACAAENNIDISSMEIYHTEDVIGMHDSPRSIASTHKNSSMAVGLQLLAEGKGDGFVTAGSTGAYVVGAHRFVKEIPGIKHAGTGAVMPNDEGVFLMMDCGANLTCTPEVLNQFAIMGSTYMEKVMGVKNPRVALANIGVEETKGTETLVEAYKLMSQQDYNFVGNIEIRDIPKGGADVVVCEGFTGNVILKMYEGVAGVLLKNIKDIFKTSAKTKLGYLLISSNMKDFKNKMDYKKHGGAPLMGISKPVAKAHGSSDARAFKYAIKQVADYADSGAIDIIAKAVSKE
ncbi:MAG: phosphate acyltransferase PlsX [Clostridia bacterium]|nr:phosphate acyltransferase PlsX [Clostridia bacterium]